MSHVYIYIYILSTVYMPWLEQAMSAHEHLRDLLTSARPTWTCKARDDWTSHSQLGWIEHAEELDGILDIDWPYLTGAEFLTTYGSQDLQFDF